MGHSQAGKSDNHQRIVKIAAQRLREKGIDGLGVAELMKEAGLTHGGFYRHFDSREQLVTEAMESALEQGGQRAAMVTAGGRKSALSALIDAYLAESHRDDPGDGCAVTALAADVARGNEAGRTAYTAQVRHYLEIIGASLKQGERRSSRQQAVLTLSALVGAVSLARAVNDEALSLEILRSTASALKA